MGRALSLAAYRTLSWRKPQPDARPVPPRPDGELVWMHASGLDRLGALCDLSARLKQQRPGLWVLATLNQDRSDAPSRQGCDLVLPLESDHPALTRQFLDHWRPSMCLWAGGDLMPNLISDAAERGVPMTLIDLSDADLPARRSRWLPDLTRATLDCFDAVLTRDAETAALLRRAGLTEDRVRVAAPLRSGASPPSCRDDDLADVTGALAGRPVWLAAGVQPGEFDFVLSAHRQAVRLVHRLLLVVSVADPVSVIELAGKLAAAGLRHGDWDDGDGIDEQTQVMISSDPRDLGLWYRVAPVTFLASTVEFGPGGRDPLEAAALGSAPLHGPNTRDFREAYANLDAAGAAKEVRDADQLGVEVIRLAAPDRAARMALAGWDVVTEGAQLTDNLIDLAQDILDTQEVLHAGT